MDQEDIQAFLAVAQYGTISKAAEKLYISHSTLSWRIGRLESEFGTDLFSRGKGLKKVELTKAGNTFLPYAERLMDTWQEAMRVMGKVDEESLSVVIGPNHNLLFNDVYKEFSLEFPDIPLYLLLRHADDAYRYVSSGEMDAGFVAVEHPGNRVEAIPICKEQLVFICGSNAEFAEHSVITADMLQTENEIKWWFSPSGVAEWQKKWFQKEPKRIVQEDTHTLEALLDESNLWTVVPLSTAQTFLSRRKGGILIKELGFECPRRDVFMILRAGSKPTSALKKFLEVMHDDFAAREIEWIYQETE